MKNLILILWLFFTFIITIGVIPIVAMVMLDVASVWFKIPDTISKINIDESGNTFWVTDNTLN